MKKISVCLFVTWILITGFSPAFARKKAPAKKVVNIITALGHHARIDYGVQKLTEALAKEGYTVKKSDFAPKRKSHGLVIQVFALNRQVIKVNGKATISGNLPKEGFRIDSSKGIIVIEGNDNSGALYGCLELADRITKQHALHTSINFTDHPEMVLRGACVGVQKPALLPGRGVYEYPYTPELFPWFYDKGLWSKYLDSLVQNRYNSLYLWNGHPFASLVKVKGYEYAVEVDDATFKKNEETYKWLAEECDKRGIWLIQGFYNIIVSKPFAVQNNLKTQDRNRHIVPVIADYTRKSIAAFVEKYPNVGLLITLGEAMEGTGQDDIDWFTKTIIPGVKDGLKALGRTDEPPIVLRAHDTDAPEDMKYAKPLYSNLYTMAKYNGEALTTYTPHGSWADLHRTLSHLGTVQVENVHIMANLEPFRYSSADFIQKCVLAMHNVYEANAVHIYPQASYWDWPYTADKTADGTRLLQVDRDWMWYKAWSRYAWNAHRDRNAEVKYWSNELAGKYGTDEAHGKDILNAYEESGEISPMILRRFGITDGNRQTMTLGMFMTQLVNPEKFGLFTLLYTSEGPEGEMLSEYAEREWKHQPHVGETPVMVINDIITRGKNAVDAIDTASPDVKKNKAEFDRLKNDMYCYNAMANSYAYKAKAALSVLRYKYSNDVVDLEKAVPDLQKSLDYYRELVKLTQNSYLYANSMQTNQRKIPITGAGAKMKEWSELLPLYEKELESFKQNITRLKSPDAMAKQAEKIVLTNVDVTIQGGLPRYSITGGQAFSDSSSAIKSIAPELKNLQGVQFSKAKQIKEGTTLTFTSAKPVKVLVGYFINKNLKTIAPEPQLETDASANDYGQADVKITSSVQITGMPPVNIHTYSFKAGTNTLTLPKGAALILGFVDDSATVPVYDAGLSNEGNIKDLRWLFDATLPGTK